jgi:DNA-binding beta-propeller fold protein YncE
MALGAIVPIAAQRPPEQSGATEQLKDCNQPLSEPITKIKLPDYAPKAVAPTRDGCFVFVGFHSRQGTPGGAGVSVMRRKGDTFEEVRFVGVPGGIPGPFALALTRDRKILLSSHGAQITFFDVEKLTSGQGDVLLGKVSGSQIGGSFGVAISPDDHYLMVAQGIRSSVVVIDLKKARTSGFDQSVLIGVIPTAVTPMGAAMSPDGRHLYTTTREAPDVVTLSSICAGGKRAEGSVQIMDAERAKSDPKSALIGFAYPAGCQPTAIAVSADGNRFSAVAAGDFKSTAPPQADNALVVFDARPVRDGRMPTLLGKVPLGTAPTAVVDTGSQIIVGSSTPGSQLTVIDASNVTSGERAIIGTIPVAAEGLALREDSRTLFGISPGLVIVDLDRVQLVAK